MNGSGVVNYLLSNNENLVAEVPAARILTCLQLPLRTALPAITVSTISRVARLTVAMSQRAFLVSERVQVMGHARDAAALRTILDLCWWACKGQAPATINGVVVDSILPDIEGPDLSQPDLKVYEQPRDFIVRWFAQQPAGKVLLEAGDELLLEDGSKVLLEDDN